MSQFSNHAPPWIPNYALPEHVEDEPLARGSIAVTDWLPRGTIDDLPDPSPAWGHGFELPGYLRKESEATGARTTPKLPRGTRPSLPSPLAGELPELGDDGDPIGTVSKAVARYLIRTLYRDVDRDWRQAALRYFLVEIEPDLYRRTMTKAKAHRQRGGSDREALERGLAEAMTEGIAREIYEAGIGGGIAPDAIISLGAYPERSEQVALGFFSSVTKPFRWAGRKTRDASKKAYSWAKTGVSKLRDATCWLVDRKHADKVGAIAGASIGAATSGGVGTSGGAAAGGAGTSALQQVCPADVEGLDPALQKMLAEGAVDPPREIPWVPIAAGVGVVALILVATR